MKKTVQNILCQVDLLEALDAVPIGVAIIDRELNILGLNRFLEALTGYTNEEARGIYCDFILRTNLRTKGNPFNTVLKRGKTLAVEGDIINKSRTKVPIRFTLSPLKARSGESVGLIITLEDISVFQDLGQTIRGIPAFEKIIGNSPKMQELFELLPAIAQTDASALIVGETGTGKDLLAEAIHQASRRSRNPFIKVNCGALPESLLESELFGYVRGAFTGAETDKPGMFRLADGGTIYLTEIGDLPLPLQVKLLTVLDDQEFFPLGGSKKVKVDVRVIAATHHDLKDLVRQGKFRQDLFFRLNVVRLHLPPLREREGDMLLLMDHFLNLFKSHLRKDIKAFHKSAIDILSNYSFPGNVRELRNIIEYAVTVCQGQTILPEHLPKYILSPEKKDTATQATSAVTTVPEEARKGKDEIGGIPLGRAESSEPLRWSEIEKRMIIESLIKAKGKRAKAAKILGWGRSTLWRKMKQYGLG